MIEIISKIPVSIKRIVSGFKEQGYSLYFLLSNFLLPKGGQYIFVDIDNTVTNQADRLRRFMKDGRCDFKKANHVSQIIHDIPLPDSVSLIRELSTKFQIVWLTSRNIKLFPVTYFWLRKSNFPVYVLVCTGSMLRKIQFLEIFKTRHSIQFIVDDMKEGHEIGIPNYVLPVKLFLERNNIKVYENLSSVNSEVLSRNDKI